LGWFAVLWRRRWALDNIAAIGEVADMAREQLFQDWERLCDQVRHPALHPALFLAAHEMDEDEELLEVEDDAVWAAVDGQQRYLARVRRGALIAAANVALDRLLGDLTRLENGDRLGGEELFVEDHLPPRYRSGYDRAFHLKLVASAAKVGFELTNPYGDYPACAAEELLLYAVLREWQLLLDITDLGAGWADALAGYLFEDLDFEHLFSEEMDGVEDDPLAGKTSGLDIRPFRDWFVPFNPDSLVHPYAVDLDTGAPELYDLTQDGEHGLADPARPPQAVPPITGFAPISEQVALARADARQHPTPGSWVPDEQRPEQSLAAANAIAGLSGHLTHQPGPSLDVTAAAVLGFTPHGAHPATGQAWAGVVYLSGRTELPMAAVVAFTPDPSIRQRWQDVFKGLVPGVDESP
jgi:hypothetical protein